MTALAAACSEDPAPEVEITGPALLSETGLYADFSARTLAPGVIPIEPRFELWSDGAEKTRYLLLPDGKQIDTSDMNAWRFPLGTKAWKQLKRDGRIVETRLLWKLRDDPKGWFQMAYVWNDAETEALAAPDGVVNARGTAHDVPAQVGCPGCHRGVADVLIGPGAIQLSRSGGEGPLTAWSREGRLSHPPTTEFQPPGDSVTQAALGHLHGNCGYCHRDGSPVGTVRTLRLELKTSDGDVAQTGAYRSAVDALAWHDFEGSRKIVTPGDPEKSQLYTRMRIRDATSAHEAFGYQMPPLCTEEPDTEGLAKVHAWINQL